MLKRSLTLIITFLLVLSMLPTLAMGNTVSCSLSAASGTAGSSITVSGTADADTWVSIKVMDSAKNILVYDAVKSGNDGSFSAVFKIPSGSSGTLTVVVGYGDNVDTKTLSVSTPSSGSPGGGGDSGGGGSTTTPEPVQVEEEEPAAPVTELKDIAGHWARESIERLVALGAISGYLDGSFRPNQPITRAEFVTVLVKAFKLESTNQKVFADTTGHWAREYIGIAAALQIVGGYSDTSFGPDDLITREQMAVMVVNAAGLSKVSAAQQFSDADQISNWAKDAVDTATSNGIITGYSDNSFKPQGNATRAEAVTVIDRALGN